MTISGWGKKYSEIVKEFHYNKKDDILAAKYLNSLIKRKFPLKKLHHLIHEKNVFVIGAGPSLSKAIPFLQKYNHITKIVADGAVKPLMDMKIKSHILVTDLDGDPESLKKIGKSKTIVVIHAHGDNVNKLNFVKNLKNFIGTTQAKEFEKIHNFGGFTDGDRCVFLANHFHAKKIILFGMDFGNKIGKYSKTKISDKSIKIKKLRRAKKLLEWLSTKNSSDLFTTSKSLKGFKKIHYKELENLLAD